MLPTSAAIIIEVRNARGSVPREDGTWMWVSKDASFGTIGGGHLEFQAMAKARELLVQMHQSDKHRATSNTTPASEIIEHFALGPSLGQCCGGALDVAYSVWSAEKVKQLQRPEQRFFLQLYGAGHVGQAIIRALAPIACTVQWIDERSEFEKLSDDSLFTKGATQNFQLDRICVDSVQAEVTLAPAQACFLVLTHSHALDLEIVDQVLRRNDFKYLGLIGSATKRARFERQLRERSFSAQDLEKLTCPIGISGVAGKEPEVIAASVVAQLLLL
jgi:xanthine dehydrogenase accessory factor